MEFSAQTFGNNLSFLANISKDLADQVTICSQHIKINNVNSNILLAVDNSVITSDLVGETRNAFGTQQSMMGNISFVRVEAERELCKKDIKSILADLIDSEEIYTLQSYPISNLSEPVQHSSNKKTLILLSALSLLYFVDHAIEEEFSNIIIIDVDCLHLAISLHAINLSRIISRCKESECGFDLFIPSNAEIIEHLFFDKLSNSLPSAFYGFSLIQHPLASERLVALASWMHARDGLHEYVLGYLGNDTDEINQVMHSVVNATVSSKSFCLVPQKLPSDIPVVLTASGPSLDKSVEWLQKEQSNLFIVASGSSLGTLMRQGIAPSAVVILEMGSIVYHDIKVLIDEGHCLKGIILIASVTVDPRLVSLFKDVIYFHRPLSSAFALFPHEKLSALPQAGPQVANAALEALAIMGIRKFLLLGCDFSKSLSGEERASSALGTSQRRFNLPHKGRLGSTVFTSSEQSVTCQLFSNIITIMSLDCAVVGNGLVIDGANPYESVYDIDNLHEYFCDPLSLTQELLSLPPRSCDDAHLVQILTDASSKLDMLQLNIVDIIRKSERWESDLARNLSSFISRDQILEHDDPATLLNRRLTRFFLFFVFQSLHDLFGSENLSSSSFRSDAIAMKAVCTDAIASYFLMLKIFYSSLVAFVQAESSKSDEWCPARFAELIRKWPHGLY